MKISFEEQKKNAEYELMLVNFELANLENTLLRAKINKVKELSSRASNAEQELEQLKTMEAEHGKNGR